MLAFVGETRILEINTEDELDEAEIEGFDAEQQVHLNSKLLAACVKSMLVDTSLLPQASRHQSIMAEQVMQA